MGVAAAAACTYLIAVSVAVLALVRGRPLHNAGYVLLATVPVLVVGQVWAIAIQRARKLSRPRSRQSLLSWKRAWRRQFGDLPPAIAVATPLLAFGSWLLGMSAFAHLTLGGATAGTPSCPYRLNNHGSITCVSHSDYLKVKAAEQRLLGGVLSFFYVI